MRRARTSGNKPSQVSDLLIALEGIVVDTNDTEGMHRVRVVIPSIDEYSIHDEWVTYMMPWVGPNGYGPANLPPLNSEVLLFGRLGQPYSLFCVSRYNEDFNVPSEFADGSRGLKCDTDYKILCDLIIWLVSQTRVIVRGGSEVDLEAPDVFIRGAGAESVHTQGNKVGFLGAAPAERQSLPTDANDLATCIALCNALKHSIAIKFGLAG
jgi:hypothetical protein